MWWMFLCYIGAHECGKYGIIVEDYMNVVDVPPLLVYKNVVNVV